MKISSYILILMLSAAWMLSSCSKDKLHRKPGRIYAPDMTYSQA